MTAQQLVAWATNLRAYSYIFEKETQSKERLQLIKLSEKIYKEKEQKLGKPTILELKVNQGKEQLVQPLDEGEKETQVVKVGHRFQDCKPVGQPTITARSNTCKFKDYRRDGREKPKWVFLQGPVEL